MSRSELSNVVRGSNKISIQKAPPAEDGEDSTTLVAADHTCLEHKGPDNLFHNETPERYAKILQLFDDCGVWDRVDKTGGRRATDEEFASGGVHSRKYMNMLKRKYKQLLDDESRDFFWLDASENTYFCKNTLDVTRIALAGAIDCTELVWLGQYMNSFSVMRPPGHHCCVSEQEQRNNETSGTRTTASGFCIANNVASAVVLLIAKHGQEFLEKNGRKMRVAIVDLDAHHGDGTEKLFYDNDQVLYYSQHRRDADFFPYPAGSYKRQGEGEGKGLNVNVPLKKNYGDLEAYLAMMEVGIPVLSTFKPDIILFSAGFDGLSGDIAELNMTPSFFGWVTRKLMEISSRVVVVLEGGYEPDQLAQGCLWVVSALTGDDQGPPENASSGQPPTDSFRRHIEKVKRAHKRYWNCIELKEVPIRTLKDSNDSSHRKRKRRHSSDEEYVGKAFDATSISPRKTRESEIQPLKF